MRRFFFGLLALAGFLFSMPAWAAPDPSLICHFNCKNGQVLQQPNVCASADDLTLECLHACGNTCQAFGGCVEASANCLKGVAGNASAPTPSSPTRKGEESFGLRDPLHGATIPEVIGKVIRFALGLVGVLFLCVFLYGGFLWIVSGGDEKKITAAKTALRNALIGIVIVALSYAALTALFKLTATVQQTAPATTASGAPGQP